MVQRELFYYKRFSRIFYSKVLFVPSVDSQIVKMYDFDPHLAPPTFGAGPDLPIFVIRVHGYIYHISLVRVRDTFAVVRTLAPVIHGMSQ